MNNDGRWQKGTILSSLIHHFPIRLRHSLRVLLNIVAQCSLQSIIRICKDVWIYLTFLKPSFWDPRFSKPLLFALLWLTFNEATLCSQWNHMFDFSCSLRLNRIQLWFLFLPVANHTHLSQWREQTRWWWPLSIRYNLETATKWG